MYLSISHILFDFFYRILYNERKAFVAELVDAADSKSAVLWDMGVRVSPRAPNLNYYKNLDFGYIFRIEKYNRYIIQ